jgi:Resolvase, N terminal domain
VPVRSWIFHVAKVCRESKLFRDDIRERQVSPCLVGYASVSTDDQDLNLQRTALKGAGCKRICEEKVSGAKRQRPELTRMLDHLCADDVLVASRLDRLVRSTRDLLEIAELLKQAEAGLRSLHEPWADTTSQRAGGAMAPRDSGTTHVAFGAHDGLGLHDVVISWLNPTPHAITVYAADPALPRRPQHSLPGGSLRLTRTGLAPVGSRQLPWRTVR